MIQAKMVFKAQVSPNLSNLLQR